MSDQALASAIFGLNAGAVYLTPILGGLLADQWLGRRRTVVLGGALMTLGHFLMAFEQPFLLALACMVLGAGFKGNIGFQVGALYAPDDQRRAAAFQVFYLGINAGAICASLICGALGETVGWHYGFGAAGVGMVVGLVIYLAGSRHLPADHRRGLLPPTRRRQMLAGGLGGMLDKMPAAQFWLLHAGLVCASVVGFIVVRRLGCRLLEAAPSTASSSD